MLYEAIKTHDEENLKKALDAGENLFEKQANGVSPFELCCLIGDSTMKNVVFHHIEKGIAPKKKARVKG